MRKSRSGSAIVALVAIACGRTDLGFDVEVAEAVDAGADAAIDTSAMDATAIDASAIDANAIDASAMDATAPDACEATLDPDPPRPIAPLSTATVTSQRPALHWTLPIGADGALVNVCADRACTDVVVTFAARGDHGAPPSPLAHGVYFWNVRSTSCGAIGARVSPTWEMFVGARSAPADTSWGTVFDPNGDGLAEIVTSDPYAFNHQGAVFVFTGARGGPNTTPTVLQRPSSSTAYFAEGVASAGDVDGDGFADLVVGGGDQAGGGGGAVWLYTGGAAGLESTPARIPTPVSPTLGYFGWPVASAGDVNGDGYADVLIGAGYQYGKTTSRAAIYLYYGGKSGLDPTPVLVHGGGTNDYWYFLGSTAGDVNGDGFADVMIGHPIGASGTPAWLYLGGPNGIASTPVIIPNPTPDHPYASNSYFGTPACAGDVNGDGIPDVIISDYSHIPNSLSAYGATVYVYPGTGSGLGAVPWVLVPPSALMMMPNFNYFATAIASARDVDADGYDDVVVGAEGGYGAITGAAFIYRGSAMGMLPDPVMLTPPPLGPTPTQYGWTVAGPGDVDGDGFDDIAVGGPNTFFKIGTQYVTGAVFFHTGGAPFVATTPTILSSLAYPGERFGTVVY